MNIACMQRLVLVLVLAGGIEAGQVPGILSHQGRLTVDGLSFTGIAHFKFALVSEAGDLTWWSHDGTSSGGSEPNGQPIALPVNRGVFSVNLGDTTVAHMSQPIPASVFQHESVWLRVWVDDGVNGFLRLTPDRRITAAGYALVAGSALGPAATAVSFSGELAGDVTGTQTATVVNSVGGVSAAQVASGATAANSATAANLPGAIVKRDASGDVAVGTISGKFVGDGSGLTNLPLDPGGGQLPSGAILVSAQAEDPQLLSQGYRAMMTVPAPPWIDGSTLDAPSARAGHSALWDGASMLIWGGSAATTVYLNSGGTYRPDTDTWTALSTIDAPSPRSGHTAVWTGSEMIVWGGVGSDGDLQTGGKFRPSTQTWTPLATSGAPAARKGHQAVWTGDRMLVWGGLNSSGLCADGAFYDPVANQWTTLAVANPPEARTEATAVWAGDRFIVWGGTGSAGELNSGGQLLFASGQPTLWQATSLTGTPSARRGHAAVWTGDRMLVWGGQRGETMLGDGAGFDPQANAWTSIAPGSAPAARSGHVGVWTGLELLIVAGADAGGDFAAGAAYDPASGQWRSLSRAGNPLARRQPAAVWTGSEVMVFGGMSAGQRVGALQRLVPQPVWHFYRKL